MDTELPPDVIESPALRSVPHLLVAVTAILGVAIAGWTVHHETPRPPGARPAVTRPRTTSTPQASPLPSAEREHAAHEHSEHSEHSTIRAPGPPPPPPAP